MLGAERLDADRADGRLVGRKVVRLKVLARVSTVGAELAAERAPDLAHAGLLAVQLGQVVQVVGVTHYYLASS